MIFGRHRVREEALLMLMVNGVPRLCSSPSKNRFALVVRQNPARRGLEPRRARCIENGGARDLRRSLLVRRKPKEGRLPFTQCIFIKGEEKRKKRAEEGGMSARSSLPR